MCVAKPDVVSHSITTNDRFIIMGTAELWRSLSNADAVQCVIDALQDGDNNLAGAVIKAAVSNRYGQRLIERNQHCISEDMTGKKTKQKKTIFFKCVCFFSVVLHTAQACNSFNAFVARSNFWIVLPFLIVYIYIYTMYILYYACESHGPEARDRSAETQRDTGSQKQKQKKRNENKKTPPVSVVDFPPPKKI